MGPNDGTHFICDLCIPTTRFFAKTRQAPNTYAQHLNDYHVNKDNPISEELINRLNEDGIKFCRCCDKFFSTTNLNSHLNKKHQNDNDIQQNIMSEIEEDEKMIQPVNNQPNQPLQPQPVQPQPLQPLPQQQPINQQPHRSLNFPIDDVTQLPSDYNFDPTLLSSIPSYVEKQFLDTAEPILQLISVCVPDDVCNYHNIQQQTLEKAILALLLLVRRGLVAGKHDGKKHKAGIIRALRLYRQSFQDDIVFLPQILPTHHRRNHKVVDPHPIKTNCRRALTHIRNGHVGKAAKALEQSNIADTGSQQTIDQLTSILHPDSEHDKRQQMINNMKRNHVPNNSLIRVDKGILTTIIQKQLENGTKPGPSGWTGEIVAVLLKRESCLAGLIKLVSVIINGSITSELIQRMLVSSKIVPLEKSNNSVRPIAMGEVFTKLAGYYLLHIVEPHISKVFPTIQLGVNTKSGVEKATHALQTGIDSIMHHASQHNQLHPMLQPMMLCIDFKNAYNNRNRNIIYDELAKRTELKPLHNYYHFTYATSTPSLLYNSQLKLSACIENLDGVRQGDAISPLLFSLSVQSLYESALNAAQLDVQQAQHPKPAGFTPFTTAVAYLDDLTFIGTASSVLAGFDTLKSEAEKQQFPLNVNKCSTTWFTSPDVPVDVEKECSDRSLTINKTCTKVLGTLIGSDRSVMQQQLYDDFSKKKINYFNV